MTKTTATPNPLAVFGNRKAPAMPARPQIAAPIDLTDPGTIVRPGLVEVVADDVVHDGVVKAKHLKRGQRVRPFVRDRETGEQSPRGSERIVGSVERIQGGAFVKITWASAHSAETRPASYRFFDEALVGGPVVINVPGFVAYQEV